ncbi:MAG: carbon-nitrogen hydrolase [Kiritimatiellia bacterium]
MSESQSHMLRAGLVQLQSRAGKEANWEATAGEIGKLAGQGVQVVCLQELFLSRYFCDQENPVNFALAEPIPGADATRVQELAGELGVVIVASLFERRAPGLYHNTAIVADADGSLAGLYRKAHIPDDPGYYEKYYFTPGDTGYRVFRTKFARIGVLVCWDQWYPEAARLTCLQGADLLVYPTAIGWDLEERDPAVNRAQHDAWRTMQRSHAIANGVHVIAVNRTGCEAGQQFWGGSFVADPSGVLLYEAPHDDEVSAVVDLDLSRSDTIRTQWPFLRDRRIDTYGGITSRWLDEEVS